MTFQFVGDRRVLRDSSRREMQWPVFRDPRTKDAFGIGWAVAELDGRRTVGHGGAIYGYRSHCLLAPDSRVGVVVLVNCAYEPNRLCRRLLEVLLPVVERIGDGGGKAVAATGLPIEWQELIGPYEWPGFTKIRVGHSGQRLVYHAGEHPASDAPELRPVDAKAFRVHGGPYNGERAWFERDADGGIVRLWIGAYPFDRRS